MFEFVKHIFTSKMMFFGWNLSKVNSLKFISMSNQERKIRPEVINVNSDEPSFYPYSVKYINAVVVVVTSIIHMQKYVFQM